MKAFGWVTGEVPTARVRLAAGSESEFVSGLEVIANRAGRSLPQLAIAWTLRRPAVTAAIVGLRQPGQVEGVIQAGRIRLADDHVAQISALFEENP